jgi:hypothetical protein
MNNSQKVNLKIKKFAMLPTAAGQSEFIMAGIIKPVRRRRLNQKSPPSPTNTNMGENGDFL